MESLLDTLRQDREELFQVVGDLDAVCRSFAGGRFHATAVAKPRRESDGGRRTPGAKGAWYHGLASSRLRRRHQLCSYAASATFVALAR